MQYAGAGADQGGRPLKSQKVLLTIISHVGHPPDRDFLPSRLQHTIALPLFTW